MSATAGARYARAPGPLPWGAIRLAVVVVGGLLVLQSSARVDVPKLIYLAAAGIALGGAVYSVVTGWDRIGRPYRRLLVVDVLFIFVLGASFPVAALNHTPALDWFRDVLGYALFAAVPILAYDAGASSGRRFMTILLVVAGVLASLSWALVWLDRRGLADLPLDRLLLPAGHLAIALYALSLAAAMASRNRPYAWAALAGAILGMLLATGTRSSLLLLAAPLAMAVLVRPRAISHTLRVIGLHLLTALVVFIGTDVVLQAAPVLAPRPGASVEAGAPDAGERIESIENLATNPGSDPSVKERVAQYGAALGLFISSPMIGVGPGHEIVWTDVSGSPRDEFTADTPLVLPAKFGLIGTALVALLFAAYVSVVAHLVRRGGWAAEPLALVGFAAYAAVSLPLGMPIEEKGFSLALMVLLGLALSAAPPNDLVGAR